MTVLVTGAAGFLGYHACKYYRGLGEDVIGVDNLAKHEYTRAGYDVDVIRTYVLDRLKIYGVDFRKDDIRTMSLKDDIDFIVHCAAQPAMTVAIENPMYDFNVNVVGTINVLNHAIAKNAPMVNCSSIHVYGNSKARHTKPQSEESQLLFGDVTPLHASKLSAEYYCRASVDTYGAKVANYRLTGMYGPMQFGGEDHGWVANFMIRHLLSRPIKVYGTVEQYRDILYVDDAVTAIDAFRKRPVSDTYNVGGGEAYLFSIRDLFEVLEAFTGRPVSYTMEPERKGDLHWFCCDISRMWKNLMWKPTISPEDGIYNQFYWIKDNLEMF